MRHFNIVLKIILVAFLLWATVLFARAFFSEPKLGEAYYGSFDSSDFSKGWTVVSGNTDISGEVTLPIDVESTSGSTIVLKNTLPDDIRTGMRLCTRASVSDIKISINGRLRAEYVKRNSLTQRVPLSAFVMADLYDYDAGGEIKLYITPSRNGLININSIAYAYGNNVWFTYIKENLVIVSMAVLLIMAGIGAVIVYLIFSRKNGVNKTILYLGFLTLDVGMWMIGESHLRQIIFGSTSYANIFSYLFIETVAGFGAMYFDEIQEHSYNKYYTVLTTLLVLQVIINSALNFLKVIDYYYTLKYSHVWSALIILCILITTINDIRLGRGKNYWKMVIGAIGFLVSCMLEVVSFYIDPAAKLGGWISLGLLFLMAMTLLQTVKNLLAASEERRMYSEKMNEMIFQTIERAIEPKEDTSDDGVGPADRAGMGKIHVAVVDDNKTNLMIAGKILSENGMYVTGFKSGPQLLEYVKTNSPDLILLDIFMPEMDGFEVMEKLKEERKGKTDIPVIFLSGSDDYKSETKGLQLGAMDYIKKPFVPDAFVLRVRNTIELVRLQNDLFSEVRRKSIENDALSFHVVQTLAEAIDAKDTYTNGHSTRVAQYSKEIARRFGYSKEDQDEIYMMGLLHDVGKIGVPDEVINKTGKLTDEEFALIKKHPVTGYNILAKIKEMPRLQIGAHWHHERYDGKGYPDGIAGEEIPEEARIIAVADAYDAMTSHRSYRDVLPQSTVIEEIEKGKGRQFDPAFADIMLEIISEDVIYGLREK